MWPQTNRFEIPKTHALFGYSVGVSEKYVIAGAPRDDAANAVGAGSAYVFTL